MQYRSDSFTDIPVVYSALQRIKFFAGSDDSIRHGTTCDYILTLHSFAANRTGLENRVGVISVPSGVPAREACAHATTMYSQGDKTICVIVSQNRWQRSLHLPRLCCL